MKQADGLQWANGPEPGALAPGWYEAGRWPESKGRNCYPTFKADSDRYMNSYIKDVQGCKFQGRGSILEIWG